MRVKKYKNFVYRKVQLSSSKVVLLCNWNITLKCFKNSQEKHLILILGLIFLCTIFNWVIFQGFKFSARDTPKRWLRANWLKFSAKNSNTMKTCESLFSHPSSSKKLQKVNSVWSMEKKKKTAPRFLKILNMFRVNLSFEFFSSKSMRVAGFGNWNPFCVDFLKLLISRRYSRSYERKRNWSSVRKREKSLRLTKCKSKISFLVSNLYLLSLLKKSSML